MNGSKVPHSLRLSIFFLRLTLGLNFFYLGLSSLFDNVLGRQLRTRSLANLYDWLFAVPSANPAHVFFEWAFLILGACLILGIFTRVLSIAGIALMLVSFIPGIQSGAIVITQFVNDEVIVIACFLVLIFSDAGAYFGLDKFMHIHFSSKHKK